MILPDKERNLIEEFISKNKSKSDIADSITLANLSNGEKLYKKIQKSSVSSGYYSIFGHSGFTSYAMYKSNTDKIYLIESDPWSKNMISGYGVIDNSFTMCKG